MTKQEIRNNTHLSLMKAFPHAAHTGEYALRAVYTDDLLETNEQVTIDVRVDEDGVARFSFSKPVKIKPKACKEIQLYLNRVRDRSEDKITRAELMNNGRLLVMETWMEQTDSGWLDVETIESFYFKSVGFLITLSFSFSWLDQLAAARKNDL